MHKTYINKVRIGERNIDSIISHVQLYFKQKKKTYFHIVNLNPEIFVRASKSKFYRNVINTANEILIDGIGIKLLAKIIGIKAGEKLAGTDLMHKLISLAVQNNKKVFFLGGCKDSAKLTADYFKFRFPTLRTGYSSGANSIIRETNGEKSSILANIKRFKPSLLFVAYGPPWQEIWIYNSRDKLGGVVCMGVGGSFNFYARRVVRAPRLFIKNNLEWFWRFICEPHRLLTKGPYYMYFLMYSLFLYLNNLINTRCFNRSRYTTNNT